MAISGRETSSFGRRETDPGKTGKRLNSIVSINGHLKPIFQGRAGFVAYFSSVPDPMSPVKYSNRIQQPRTSAAYRPTAGQPVDPETAKHSMLAP
jgi:hypothetical protein